MLAGAVTWAADETVPTETQYAQIQQAFLQERFEQVAALVPPILADAFLEPKTVRIWLWLVLSQERLQRTNGALTELDRLKSSVAALPDTTAVKLWTESVWPEILFWEGEVSRKAQKMVRSRLAYQRLLQNYPSSVWRTQAQLGLGLVYLHEQAYDQAQAYFEQVARTSTNQTIATQALLWQGLCQLQAKQYEPAAARFQQVLDQQAAAAPLRGQAAFYLGEALTGLRRFGDASSAYQRALEADPQSAWSKDALFGLGWSLFQQGQCQASLQALDRYLQAQSPAPATAALTPPAAGAFTEQQGRVSGDVLFAQGRCLMQLGQAQEALDRFETLRANDADHPLAVDAGLSAMELLQQLQRVDDAQALAHELMVRPMQPAQRLQWHMRMGSLGLAQGEADAAQEEFAQAAEADDPVLRQAALNGLGDAALLAGRDEDATRKYREAIEASAAAPGALYAKYQLGRVMLQAHRTNEAAAIFRELLSRTAAISDDRALAADVRLALAFVAIVQGDPERAQIELDELQAQQPTGAQAARADYYRALLAVQDGDASAARRFCEETVSHGPHTDEALEARLLLADLTASDESPGAALKQLQRLAGQGAAMPRHQRGMLAKKLGDFARRAEQYAQAIAWYERAWEDLPAERGELDYRLASCYEEGSDIAVAMQRYRMIQQTPWQIRGQLALAKLMERQERWQDAQRIYESIASQAAPEAKIAQERLTLLRSQEEQPHVARVVR